MRSGDPGWEVSKLGTDGSWRINIEPGFAWKQRGAWGTPFSCFRFAIPELCGFEGRAVYLDADMLVLGDVRELLEMPVERGYRSISMPRTDVSLIDCSWFADKEWWPKIAQMKASGWITWHYCQLLRQHSGIAPTLDPRWNDCDGLGDLQQAGFAKLVHYTSVPDGQPYCPYPTVNYFVPFPHARNKQAGILWWKSFRESLGSEGLPRLREALAEAYRRVAKRVPEEAYLREVMQRCGVSKEEAEATA